MDQLTKDLLLARRMVESGTARGLRESAGLSREESARACNPQVTPGAIRLWEAGLRRPHGIKGAAYGAFLRELMSGTAVGMAS